MYKGIIFDLDGTVLDTIEDLRDATNQAMKELGYYGEYTSEEIMKKVGNGFRVLIEKAVPEGTSADDVDKALEVFTGKYNECYNNKTHPYPDVFEAIKKLDKLNVKLAVNSNKADPFTKALIAKNYPDINWVEVLGHRDGKKKKPDPEAALEIADKMKLDIKDIVYVGDSEVDIKTGQNAGMDTIAVVWGFRPLQTLLSAKPSYLANNVDEMLDFILK